MRPYDRFYPSGGLHANDVPLPSLLPALLVYDWVITLGQETRYVWRSKFRGYTALFFLNRINMAGMIVAILLGLTPWHTGEVRPTLVVHQRKAHTFCRGTWLCGFVILSDRSLAL